jgi:Flp pilus assembly protein TadG
MKKRRGGQALEFALVLPIVLAIFSGIIDYGWYFHKQNLLTQMVKDSARGASVLDSRESSVSPCQFFNQSFQADSNRLGLGQGASVSSQIITVQEKRLELIVNQPYIPLFGLTATPARNFIKTLVRLEDQNWEGC